MTLCPCKDRAAHLCPGEWEPGCDLGANEKFVRVVDIAGAESVRPKFANREGEREGYAVEAALQFGFEIVDDDATTYSATGAQILAMLDHVKKQSAPTPEAQQFEAVGRWLMTHAWSVSLRYDRHDPANRLTSVTITSKDSVTAAPNFYAGMVRDILGAKS